MNNHYNCIYMYTNKINGKRYIGQARNFNRRHRKHISSSYNEEEKYHYSYTLTKTTSECLKPIKYSLSYEKDINTLDAIYYIKGNIFHGIGFT